MGRRLKTERTPGNPNYKSISLPHRAVLIIKFGIDRHPERMYNGVADVLISMLRSNEDYLKWEREYEEVNKTG